MFRPVGPGGYLYVAWRILERMRQDVFLATLLCVASLPIQEQIGLRLAPAVVLPVLGIAVSVFLGFRNTQAYNRWWEARTLLGKLVNQSRNWRDGLLGLLSPSAPGIQPLLQRQVLLMWTLNRELRGELHPRSQAGLQELELQLERRNPSSQLLLQDQALAIRQLAEADWLDGHGRVALLRILDEVCNALGGLERIRNQPLPISSTMFIRIVTWIFGYMLYLRLDAKDEGPGTLVGWLAFLGFLVAERIGAYIEKPFENPCFGLPVNRICATITANLLGAEHPLATPPEGQQARVWT